MTYEDVSTRRRWNESAARKPGVTGFLKGLQPNCQIERCEAAMVIHAF